jgi:hypothetical protein
VLYRVKTPALITVSLKQYGPGIVVLNLIPALRSLRQKDHEFKGNLGYIVRPCLKNEKKKGTHTHYETKLHIFTMASNVFVYKRYKIKIYMIGTYFS